MEKNKIPYIIRRIRPLFDKDSKPILNDRIKDRKVYERSNRNPEIVASDYGYYSSEELEFLRAQVYKVKKNTLEYWEDSNGNISTVESNANDISLRKLNRFHGWNCWIGIERLHVYPNGDVYRSTCKQGGRLGNLYEDFEMPSEPVICGKQRCTCSWAINTTKIKNKNYLSLFEHAPNATNI